MIKNILIGIYIFINGLINIKLNKLSFIKMWEMLMIVGKINKYEIFLYIFFVSILCFILIFCNIL